METPESKRASLIPGEWVSSIDLSDACLHASHGPTGLYNDCKRSEAHAPEGE